MDGGGSGGGGGGGDVINGRCPRCELCGRVVRVRGVGMVGVWCGVCMGGGSPVCGVGE